MTGNPLSGHTNHNQSSMAGSGVFTDGLADGDHIQSPTLTNYLEGIHNNGILLEEDTALGASNRNVPEDLPGVCERVTNVNRVRVTGGSAVIDGVLYEFAGGPGGTLNVDLTTSSVHRRATYSALTSGQEALIVVYVSAKPSVDCIQWELGTPITTATNAYPITPSAFLNDPDTLTTLTSKQSVVLAVLRVVYNDTSGGGDLDLAITESNDKRVFIRPSPIYLSPVTTGAVGAVNAPVDDHTELAAMVSGAGGDLTGSNFGALWQSHGAQLGSTTAADNEKDVLYYTGTHAARFTRSVFDRVLTSTATSITLKSTDANILLLTPGGSATVTTSGPFPAGYIIELRNLHATNSVVFSRASSYSVAGGTLTRFVCTTSHATTPVFSVLSDDSIETLQIGDDQVTYAKIQNVSATDRILGRDSSGAGISEEISPANVRTMLNVADGATAYTDADAIAAVEGESTLVLQSGVTVGTDLKLTTSSDHAIIENVTQDKDIIFKANDGGTPTEIMRIDGSTSRIGIGTNAPDAMLHLSSGVDQNPQIILENTQNIATDNTTDEPELIFKRSGSSNSATSGDIGKIRFIGKDDGGDNHDYCMINADAPDETAGTEDGRILIYVTKVGSSVEHLRMSGSEGVIFNHNQEDINFMIAGKDNDNIFYVDGGTEKVGIGTASPGANLHVVGAGSGDHLILEGTLGSAATSAPNFVLFRNGDDAAADIDDNDLIGQIVFRGENDASTPQEVNYATIEGGMDDTSDGSEDGHLTFNLIEAGTLTEFMRIRATTRDVVVNDQSDDIDFRVEGNTNANLLFTDASADMVGIGTNAPAATLDILSGGTFRNTRLLTVSVSGSTTLTEAAHAGRYNICAGNITLPSTSTAGEHYAILNTTGGNITIGRNGNNINGAGSDFTLATYKAATCIAIGSNNWMIVG